MSSVSDGRRRGTVTRAAVRWGGVAAAVAAVLAGASAVWHGGDAAATSGPRIAAVGAENEYANVIGQIGGPYVAVSSILDNPNVDPHTYEANTHDAEMVAGARLIVQNGVGYDHFMNTLEAASPSRDRVVITVASVLRLSPRTPNPHLWYKPGTMSAVAAVIARDLSRMEPAHRTYFAKALKRFDGSLNTWYTDITRLKRAAHGAPVAVTEPVADYLLQAAGLHIKTPWAFQAAIMNSTDPSPEDVTIETHLLTRRAVRVFVYNQQAVDSVTQHLLQVARASRVPVVGVYETMPAKHTYQTWMEDETTAIERAIVDHQSEVTMP